jgi:hypothetical protein
MRAPWRHCCLECRYPAGHPEDQSISIRYLDSDDDFEIVARALADAFKLVEARGWQLAGVTQGRTVRPRRGKDVRVIERKSIATTSSEQTTNMRSLFD